jgi:hypothetical protein
MQAHGVPIAVPMCCHQKVAAIWKTLEVITRRNVSTINLEGKFGGGLLPREAIKSMMACTPMSGSILVYMAEASTVKIWAFGGSVPRLVTKSITCWEFRRYEAMQGRKLHMW